MTLGMEVGLGSGHIVLNGAQLFLPQKGHSPRFSVHIYCGQTAEWIKTALGMEVGLGLDDIVWDGDSAPPEKKAQPPPNFGSCLFRPNGWMHEDATWYGSVLRRGYIVLDGHPALSHAPRGTVPPNFRPISVAAKWLNGVRRHFVWR